MKGGKKSTSQLWFSADLARLRKSMHRAEADWLKKKGSSDQGNSRNDYLRARNMYAKAVKRAKRNLQLRKRRELESELSCPKKFWRSLRRLNVRNTKKNRNLLEVLDEDGKLRTDEEAVGVWAHILASCWEHIWRWLSIPRIEVVVMGVLRRSLKIAYVSP